jgi:glycerophosphoryl diester phosphodiesterase
MAPPWLTERPFAHRGLYARDSGIPENCIAGFEAAIAAGYGIELDVQETADSQPVVFHDYTLERLTDESGAVIQRRLGDLEMIPLKGSNQRIASLAEVLKMVDGRTPILIEVKTRKRRPGPFEAAVAAVVAGYKGPAALMSFNIHSMVWLKTHAPETTRGLVATRLRYGGRDLPLSVEFLPLAFNAKRCGADFVAYDFRLIPTPETQDLRKKGMPVLTWTVKRPEDREKAQQFADGMIFEGWRP